MASKDLEKRGGGVAAYTSEHMPALSAEEVRARVNLIQQVMQGVMKPGIHYGKIPGAGDKPSLFKPGAETLAVTFQLAPDPQVEDLSTSDNVHYRVKVRFTSQQTGAYLGTGVGECSSDEEKYRWRKAICDEEYEEAAEDRRRIAFKKYQGKINRVKQIRTQPADVANTILKMAKKRAQVDGTLSVTGASDLFSQDIEDLPDSLRTIIADTEDAEVVEIASPEDVAALLAFAAGKTAGQGKPVSERAILQNLKRQFHYDGPLTEVTVPMLESVRKGLEGLADMPAPVVARGVQGDDSGFGEDGTPEGGEEQNEDSGEMASKGQMKTFGEIWDRAVNEGHDEGELLAAVCDATGAPTLDKLTAQQADTAIKYVEAQL